MKSKLSAVVFGLLLAAGLSVPAAHASATNQKVIFKVDGPVELPGMVLGPGRYEIQLLGFGNQAAEVWNAKETQFYGFFDTVPVDRSEAIGSAKVVLAGSGKESPKRLEEWFYPGDVVGHELVFPIGTNMRLAKTHQRHQEMNG